MCLHIVHVVFHQRSDPTETSQKGFVLPGYFEHDFATPIE